MANGICDDQYCVVESNELKDLVKSVDEKIRESWRTTGGIATIEGVVGYVYMQAMVRYTLLTE